MLTALHETEAPAWLRQVPAVESLRCTWVQNYLWNGTELLWRGADNIPPAAKIISSPHDNEAHFARKHTTQWVGYKVNITATCDDDSPSLLTHVETMAAPISDGQATPKIYAAL